MALLAHVQDVINVAAMLAPASDMDVTLLLQESRVVRVIKKQLVKRSLDLLKEVAERPEKDGKKDYETFWDAFGKFIKLGAIEDQANK